MLDPPLEFNAAGLQAPYILAAYQLHSPSSSDQLSNLGVDIS